jgi:hypothetical protein
MIMSKPKIYNSDVVVSPPSNDDSGAKIATKNETQGQNSEGLIRFQVSPAPAVSESTGPLRTLFVSKTWTTPIDTNTQFTSIPLALAKIGLATSNTPIALAPWTIIVYPGTYNEPIDMLSNVSSVGINQNCVILGSAASLTWVCGTGLNVGNTANREVVGFSNFTTLSHITLDRTTKTGSTTLATFDNVTMSSGLKNFWISGRNAVVPATDDRVEITSCTLDAANYFTERYGYVRKTDTRSKFGSFHNGSGSQSGSSLYFAKNCQDYGGTRNFVATNAWYFNCITAAFLYQSLAGPDVLDPNYGSILSFDNCLFDIETAPAQIKGYDDFSHYFLRHCTIQQNMIAANNVWARRTYCDVDRWEFAMQSIEPGETIFGNFYPGTYLYYDSTHNLRLPSTNYVTMTAGEVSHTCPIEVEYVNPESKTIIATNQTSQPWAVCVTSSNSASAPIPPF